MKQIKAVKNAGPYHVTSHSQGGGMVYFMVYPAFPKYDRQDFQWAESRYNQNGGGPGIFTSIATADALAEFLNSVYQTEQTNGWEKRIEALIDNEGKNSVFGECNKCCTVSSIPKDWVYCPVCGNKFKRKSK